MKQIYENPGRSKKQLKELLRVGYDEVTKSWNRQDYANTTLDIILDCHTSVFSNQSLSFE